MTADKTVTSMLDAIAEVRKKYEPLGAAPWMVADREAAQGQQKVPGVNSTGPAPMAPYVVKPKPCRDCGREVPVGMFCRGCARRRKF